mgnify:CR=1 FL=1
MKKILYLILLLYTSPMIFSDTVQPSKTGSSTTSQETHRGKSLAVLAGSMESPFMSIYFPLPSFAGSAFLNWGNFNFGIKAGSPAPWILGHVGNADPRQMWYVPLFYVEPIEIRYVLFERLLIGTSLGYRMLGASKGEISPSLEKPASNLDTDGTYNYEMNEWYAKAYIGFSLESNPSQVGATVFEIGGIWSMGRNETYSYKVSETSTEKNRLASLNGTNFNDYLAKNLDNFKASVYSQVFPKQYIYISVRYNLAGS